MDTQEKYAKLRGAIRTKFGTQHAFANALKMHPSTLSSKLNGRAEWSYNEVVAACRVLDIALGDAAAYFF